MHELSIKSVIKGSIETYKKEWQTLLMISFLSALISVSGELMAVLFKDFRPEFMMPLLILIGYVFKFVRFYLVGRLTVTLMLASKKSLSNESLQIWDIFEEAKSTTWRYIGYTIIFGLIMTFSFFPIGFTVFLAEIFNFLFPIKIILYLLGAALPAYVGTIYYFSLITAVVHPENSDIFSFSKGLVKDNFWKVFLLLLISLVTIFSDFLLIGIFNFLELNIIDNLALEFLSSVQNVLFLPFTVLISLEAMKTLEGKEITREYNAS